MPMNIPLPSAPDAAFGRGLNRGTNLFTNMMQRAMQQKQLEEQARQFEANKSWQREQFDALAPYRQAQLQNMQASAALNPLRKMMMEQQVQALKHSNDPMYAINNKISQFQALQNMFGGGGQGSGQQQTMQMPTEEQGQGMGMFSPEGLMGAQQDAQQQQPTGNPMLEAMKQHPELRGAFKNLFGYDPANMPQTPEEKQAAELDLFRKKQEIKQGKNQGSVPLTTAVKTKLQGVVTGVDSSLPILKEVIENYQKLPKGMESLSPSAYAAYSAKLDSIIEPLIGAFNLNATDSTKEMMHNMLYRRTNEPLKAYRNRLVDLAKDLVSRRGYSFKSLQTGMVNPESEYTRELFDDMKEDFQNMSEEELHRIAGGG